METFKELADELEGQIRGVRVAVEANLKTRSLLKKWSTITGENGLVERIVSLDLKDEESAERLRILNTVAQLEVAMSRDEDAERMHLLKIKDELDSVCNRVNYIKEHGGTHVDKLRCELKNLREEIYKQASSSLKDDIIKEIKNVQEQLDRMESNEGPPVVVEQVGSQLRIPKPTFSGCSGARFNCFQNEFEYFVTKHGIELSDTGKLLVLRSCLSGEAEKQVEDVVTFQDAWSRLSRRYSRSGAAAERFEEYIRKQQTLKSGEAERMSEFLEKTACLIKECERVGELHLVGTAGSIQSIIAVLPPVMRLEVLKAIRSASDYQEKLLILANHSDEWADLLIEEERALRLIRREKKEPGTVDYKKVEAKKFQKHSTFVSLEKHDLKGKDCIFCVNSNDHYTGKCKNWSDFTVSQRFDFVEKKKLCSICLRNNENCNGPNECRLRKLFVSCKFCSQIHAHGLCTELLEKKKVSKIHSPLNEFVNVLPTTYTSVQGKLMKTLIDTGSNANLILNKLAFEMNFQSVSTVSKLEGIAHENITCTNVFQVPVTLENGNDVVIDCLGVDSIGDVNGNVNWSSVEQLVGFKRDEFSLVEGPIEILLGSPILKVHDHDLWPVEVKRGVGFRVMKSPLSPKLVVHCFTDGQMFGMRDGAQFAIFKAGLVSSWEEYFAIDQLGTAPVKFCAGCRGCVICRDKNRSSSLRGELEDSLIQENLEYSEEDKKWYATYPKKRDVKMLSDNYNLAKKLSEKLEDRLIKADRLEDFNKSFQQQIDLGVYKVVPEDELVPKDGFAVNFVGLTESYKEGSTTPVRVCSNSSLKAGGPKGVSLNDLVSKGSNDLSPILWNLIGFRCGPIGVTADIKKFYNSVLSKDEDRHLRRVVWRWGDKTAEFSQFTTETVNFGDIGAGKTASCALNMTADMFGEGTTAAFILKNKRYVDDLGFVVKSQEEVDTIVKDLEKIMGLGGFQLKCVHRSGEEGVVNYLGLVWDKKADELRVPTEFNWKEKFRGLRLGPPLGIMDQVPKNCTRRMIFRMFAGSYDPLGLISPIVVKFRLFLRKVIQECGDSWDDVLSPGLILEAENLVKENSLIGEIGFQRDVFMEDDSVLMVCCDASEVAFGVTIHVLTSSSSGRSCRLLLSKAKLAPSKMTSIPRKELLGCLLAARLKNQVDLALDRKVPCKAFTDSSACLGWLKTASAVPSKFEEARVLEILSFIPGEDWFWLQGSQNVADLLTRGQATVKDIDADSVFQNGPQWMLEDETDWPVKSSFVKTFLTIQEPADEMFTEEEMVVDGLQPFQLGEEELVDELEENLVFQKKIPTAVECFGSFSRTVRVYARVLKFIDVLKKRAERGPPSAADMKRAKDLVCKLGQKGMTDWKKKFRSVNPEEVNGVICAKFRGHDSTSRVFGCCFKLPILEGETDLGFLVLKEAHEDGHGGLAASVFRSRKVVWVTKARKVMRNIIKHCSTCKLVDPKFGSEEVGELPQALTVPAPIFSHCGLDICGPFEVKGDKGQRKGKKWVLVLVCRTTTFIHTELLEDYSTQAFHNAFSRFLCLYPTPKSVRSDRGTQIVGFQRSVESFLSSKGIEWEYGLPGAPATNGSAEAAVKLFKRQVRILEKVSLNSAEFCTIMRKAQYFCNTRPLGVSGAGEEMNLVCPYDFLDGGLGRVPGDVQVDENFPIGARRKFMEDQFAVLWERIQTDFFPVRLSKSKKKRIQNLLVGDVVLVQELNKTRGHWVLGKVVEVMMSKDHVVRAAKVSVVGRGDKPKTLLVSVARLSFLTAGGQPGQGGV